MRPDGFGPGNIEVRRTMTSTASPNGYTAAQIALHWIIAALVFFQLILGENIVPAYRAFRRGTEVTADQMFSANLHVWVGLTVLAFAILRFGIRLRHGVPPAPPGESLLAAANRGGGASGALRRNFRDAGDRRAGVVSRSRLDGRDP